MRYLLVLIFVLNCAVTASAKDIARTEIDSITNSLKASEDKGVEALILFLKKYNEPRYVLQILELQKEFKSHINNPKNKLKINQTLVNYNLVNEGFLFYKNKINHEILSVGKELNDSNVVSDAYMSISKSYILDNELSLRKSLHYTDSSMKYLNQVNKKNLSMLHLKIGKDLKSKLMMFVLLELK